MNQIVITRDIDGSLWIKEMSVEGTEREHTLGPEISVAMVTNYMREIIAGLVPVKGGGR